MSMLLASQIWKSLDHNIKSPFGTLTTLAPSFLNENYDDFKQGPFMTLFENTREECIKLGFLKQSQSQTISSFKDVRLLLLRGRYKEIKDYFSSNNFEIDLKFKWIWDHICTSSGILNEKLKSFDESYKNYLTKNNNNRIFAIEIQLCRSWIAHGNYNYAKLYIESLLKSNNLFNIAAAHRFLSQISNNSENLLSNGLIELEQKIPKDFNSIINGSYEDYLLSEIFRRLSDHYIFKTTDNKKFELAEEQIQKVLAIDPNCARLQVMAADNARHLSQLQKSEEFYLNALSFGSLNQDYIYKSLSEITSLKSFSFFFKSRVKDAKVAQLNPYLVSTAEQKIENSQIIYQQLEPYFNLSKPKDFSPLHSYAPYFCYDALKNKLEPWYNTLNIQRAMVLDFRQELDNAVNESNISAFSNKLFLDLYQNTNRSNSLDLAHSVRLLASVGKFDLSTQLITENQCNDQQSLNWAYLKVSGLFVKGITETLKTDILDECESIFRKIPICSESLRMRFSVAINGCVFASQINNIETAKAWRFRAERIIELINIDINFSDFEKNLLLSRFYRAVSYVPFIENNKLVLEKECTLIEQYALKAIAVNHKEIILYKDNLFPMLESTSRIYSFLGDNNEAKFRMEKIVKDIDPFDTKAWLQVGELREKSGDSQGAFEAYLKSSELAAPLGQIAFFKLGRYLELNSQNNYANFAFESSLKINPNGKSPLVRIACNAHGLLKKWAELTLIEKGVQI